MKNIAFNAPLHSLNLVNKAGRKSLYIQQILLILLLALIYEKMHCPKLHTDQIADLLSKTVNPSFK